jgi:hypothetical protein
VLLGQLLVGLLEISICHWLIGLPRYDMFSYSGSFLPYTDFVRNVVNMPI